MLRILYLYLFVGSRKKNTSLTLLFGAELEAGSLVLGAGTGTGVDCAQRVLKMPLIISWGKGVICFEFFSVFVWVTHYILD